MNLLDHPSKPWIYCVTSGAGASLQWTLWATPGASEYFAGGSFPYATYETDRFLGYTPESYCSPDEAVELALEAYCRACESLPEGRTPVGLAVTASVASLREHRGDHRIHVAVATPKDVLRFTETLRKGVGLDARNNDEHYATATASLLLSCAMEGKPLHWGPLACQPRLTDAELRQLFFAHPYFGWNGRREKALPFTKDVVLLPGAFNPIHQGHRDMAIAVYGRTKKPVCYMITADSPHKPALTVQDLLSRAAMFRRERRAAIGVQVLFTEGDPLYIDKVRRFPGIGFAIGADAALRMLDPEWGPPIEPMLREFLELGTTFYVFRRSAPYPLREVNAASVLLRCDDLGVPRKYWDLFKPMNEEITDISSTQIREGTR
ncbi:MAG: hypothetical protein ACRD1X_13535 [Vicinamibacteria bacterium]